MALSEDHIDTTLKSLQCYGYTKETIEKIYDNGLKNLESHILQNSKAKLSQSLLVTEEAIGKIDKYIVKSSYIHNRIFENFDYNRLLDIEKEFCIMNRIHFDDLLNIRNLIISEKGTNIKEKISRLPLDILNTFSKSLLFYIRTGLYINDENHDFFDSIYNFKKLGSFRIEEITIIGFDYKSFLLSIYLRNMCNNITIIDERKEIDIR